MVFQYISDKFSGIWGKDSFVQALRENDLCGLILLFHPHFLNPLEDLRRSMAWEIPLLATIQ